MQKIKKIAMFLLCIAMAFSFVNPLSAVAAEEVENVALDKPVYTNPINSNASRVTDGDNTYQYVTQRNRTYLDLKFNGAVEQDQDGYYHGDGSEYIIVDLGASYLIDSFTIYDFKREMSGHERDYNYDLSICNDADFTIANQSDANWTLVGGTEKELDTCVTDFELADKTVARFIKIHNLQVYGAESFILNEIEAYGMAITDPEAVKDYAVKELATYKEDAKLNSVGVAEREEVIGEYSDKINEQTTVDDVLSVLNEGLREIDKITLIENIALGKTVYASASNNKGDLIVDGDTSYQWSSSNRISFLDVSFDGSSSVKNEEGYYYKDGTYIIIDLEASYLIDSFTIYDLQNLLSGPRDYLYDVSVCNDADFSVDDYENANWIYVGTPESESDTCITDIDLSDKIIARYIKLDNLRCDVATSFALCELQAYGMAIDDVSLLREYALKELNAYYAELTLNEDEDEERTEIINDCTTRINVAATAADIVSVLNEGYESLDELFEFAKYRDAAKTEMSSYKNEDGLFTNEDRNTQLEALNKALSDIDAATAEAQVDQIVADYKALVDSFEVLVAYEIIPSPHSISYENTYYTYHKEINVVRVDGSLDKETIDYINEIFGSENVTFSTEKDDSKLNLYLTSDDKNDAVETWLRNTYGDKVNAETLAESEAHVIFADGNGISIIGNDAEGLFRGLTTIKFIKEQIEANPKGYRGFVINDYADMAFRGLIEGYYGLPWSWAEKAELLEFGSDYKMNKLVYAPKNDPYHTTQWKDLYPDESENSENNIQNVTIAAQTARKYKADLVWTAHCFGYTDAANAGENGIRYTEGDEYIEGSDINLLKAKFQQLYDAGVRTFGLLLDDCDYGPRTLDTPYEDIYNPNEALTEEVLAETTAIVNIMAEWCEEKGDCYDLIFCPASYNLNWMKNGYARFYKQAYEYQEVSYYDLHFNDNVQIITTGSSTFSNTNQSIADRFKREGVSTEIGYAEGEERRNPLMWTNYPTVDSGNTLDFGALHNFKTDLNPAEMYGIMSNPFQWAQFNKTVIPLVCQYTWNLKDYDAAEIYEAQMKYVMDTEELAEAMLVFTDHNNYRDFSLGEGTQELKDAIAAFKANISKENAEAVLAEVNKIVDACEVLLTKEEYTTVAMYEQLYPYANALKDLSTCIQDYMNMFGENSDVVALMYDSEEMYESHTSYPLKDVTGVTKYTSTGTKTLLPFANWLRENQLTVMLAANPDVEAELELRDSLSNYLDEQLALVIAEEYYHDAWIEIIDRLNDKADELKETAYADLPTLDELKAEVEELLESYEDRKPIKKESHVASSGKEVSAGNLEDPTKYPVSNIIDGNQNTTCSTIMGDPDNPAYVQIDLGESLPLQEIWVACYVGNNRWHKYDIYTSADGVTYELLENKDSEITETAKGNWFDADGVNARYVKIVGVSNSIHNYFHVGEVKVYVADADYSAVDEAIAKAEALVREHYTSEYALKEVDAAVEAVVRGKNAAEQEAVDAMAEAIEKAISELEYLPADYSAVEAAIKNVPADLTIYTSDTSKAVKDAVVTALLHDDKNIAEQSEVDEMAKAIEDAVAALELKDADYTEVDRALETVPSDLSVYTDETAKAVTDARAAVEEGKKITEQETVDAWAEAIITAVQGLEYKKASYDVVNDAIATVPEDLTIYTKETVDALNEAIAAVVEDKEITEQETVNAMAQAILDAIDVLVEKDADYSKVEAAIAGVPADLTIYTDETVKAVNDAVAAVEEGKKVTEQEAVDAMAQAIEDAVAALEEKTTVQGVTRIAGEGRIDTGLAVADMLKTTLGVEKFETVIIATSKNFADALSGSYLAYVENAPILLTSDARMDDVVKYVKANLVENGKIYILGGEVAVSKELEGKLAGYQVERLKGANRYETNLEILRAAGVADGEIIVATGKNFADSLSASAVKLPILMVKDTLTAEQKEYLGTVKADKFYIVGGTSAVTEAVESELSAYTANFERLAGRNRRETSIAVAKKFFTNTEVAVVASASNFPDGLCGGPLAAALNAPLVLTVNDKTGEAESYAAENAIDVGYVLGGTAALTDDSVVDIFGLESAEEIMIVK